MEEKLIKPLIFIPDGACPRCLSPLSIFESEISEIQLDEDGFPINHDVKYHRLYGRCQNCGLEFKDINKKGMKYSIHSKLLDILNEDYLKYLVDKNNPFGYNNKGE